MPHNNFVKITIIGDIFPGELPYTVGYGIKSQFKAHEGIQWVNKIKNICGDNDLIIGNLESPLITEENAIKNTFFGDPKFAMFLKNSGINILNIANNHILEQGSTGFYSTINTLETLNLDVVGYIKEKKSKIVYKTINDIKIAIAGFSNVDLEVIKNETHFAILNEENLDDIIARMEKENADYKILCFHWGNEYINIPSLEQRKIAYRLIDKGIDIIVGHHPHVIQPYEKYKDGHVFYSLGNFMFDFLHSGIVRKGLSATIILEKKRVADVSLKGIKLSSKNTFNQMPRNEFNIYYQKIIKLYESLIIKSDKEYKKYYNRILKRNHLFQRIKMKFYIFEELFKLKLNKKKLLLTNVYNYHVKFYKRML